MELSMEQSQRLSPQLVQYMRILQMNTQELREYLNELYQENPALELDAPGEEPLQEERLDRLGSAAQPGGFDHRTLEDGLDRLNDLPDRQGEAELEEALRAQLGQLSPELGQAVELIITSLNPSGWLSTSLELLAEETGLSLSLLKEGLNLVQSLEPKGVGARNLEECLLLQLRAKGEDTPLACAIVEHYLNALAKSHYSQIARATGASLEDVRAACRTIRGLNPKPGSGFGSGETTSYVVPDLLAVQFEDHVELVLNDRDLPHGRINDYYRELLQTTQDDEVKAYLTEKIHQVQWVLHSVEQRRSTLISCAQVILRKQAGFFRKGLGHLIPMTLEDVAEELNLHPTTVSRAIRGKYIQCAGGIFQLSSFFSRSASRETGQEATPDQVKAALRTLVETETTPLSDQQLSEMLATQGCAVSRRTVAKYREELGIPSSFERKS
jgi:RNA polymerase sigma-54 factor